MIEHNLIDEYRLITVPVVLGRGKRLFAEGTKPVALKAIDRRSTGTVALSRNAPGSRSKWGLSFMEGRQEGVESLDRAYDLSSLSGEVGALERGDRSMQQRRAGR